MSVTPSRCPACSARLRAGVPWCGQCLTDLRPAGPQRSTRSGPPEPTERVVAMAPGLASEPAAAALADAWAERLAESERGSGLPVLVAATRGRSGRLAVTVGGTVALLVTMLLGMTVLGLLV